jgi:hypothetical protein
MADRGRAFAMCFARIRRIDATASSYESYELFVQR